MTTLTPYLLFDGNCHQAMEFYKSCFGGELTVTKVKDSPAEDRMPPGQLNKAINARLKSGNVEISASDWLRLDQTPVHGNTVKEMFFGIYGALNDKFGVRWMFTAAKNG